MSSPPPADIVLDAAPRADDPEKIVHLVTATGVFTEEESRVAGELVATTLDGTDVYSFLFARDHNGEILGYTCFGLIPLSAVAFDLYWIAVHPKARGGGLATRLMRETTIAIGRSGGTQIFAETSSRDPYAPARAFYLKSGFSLAATFEDFYTLGDAKLIYRLMVRPILAIDEG